jgi:hypothetical protein
MPTATLSTAMNKASWRQPETKPAHLGTTACPSAAETLMRCSELVVCAINCCCELCSKFGLGHMLQLPVGQDLPARRTRAKMLS